MRHRAAVAMEAAVVFAGVDLGGTTGFAILGRDGKRIHSTSWKLGKQCVKSIALFAHNLRTSLMEHGAIAVGYEVVKPNQQRSKLAAGAYGRYESSVWLVCDELGLPMYSFTPYDVKRHAAGFVQAEKDDMEALAFERWGVFVKTHDEADSLFLADLTRIKALGIESTK